MTVPDTDLRDRLVAYTAGEPPLSFGLDQVVAAGRRVRRRRRRRLTAVAGAGLAVAAVVAVILVPRPATEGFRPAGPAWAALDPAPFCAAASAPATVPTVRPTTVVNEKNGYPIRIPGEPPAHAAARISCYLATEVPNRLPGFDFHRDPVTPDGTAPLEAVPSRVFDPARPGDTTPPIISASAVVSDAAGAGEIGFSSSPATESAAEAAANCTGPECTVRGGPHGEVFTVLDVHGANGYRLVNIRGYRGGPTTVFASASNGISAVAAPGEATTLEESRVARPDLPLSVDQLIDIMSSPEFDLFR